VESWRIGPIHLEARGKALSEVLAIQEEVNIRASKEGKPTIDIFDPQEEAFVRDCHAQQVWPNGWDGTEPIASTCSPPRADGIGSLFDEYMTGGDV
jgi:DNA sulfur modification protein DndC